jgi:glycine cleavage system regulatory protein
VETLAATVAEHGGNWEQSRMARLGGQFAGIVKVGAESHHVDTLRKALEALSSIGLRVVSEASSGEDAPPSRAFHLEVVGNDREGIVRDVARALASRGVNVEELDTSCESAPIAGGLLFHANAILHVPDGVDVERLQRALEAIADDLMVDVALVPAEQRRDR